MKHIGSKYTNQWASEYFHSEGLMQHKTYHTKKMCYKYIPIFFIQVRKQVLNAAIIYLVKKQHGKFSKKNNCWAEDTILKSFEHYQFSVSISREKETYIFNSDSKINTVSRSLTLNEGNGWDILKWWGNSWTHVSSPIITTRLPFLAIYK